MLRLAQKRFTSGALAQKKVTLLQADVQNMSFFADAFFDIIYEFGGREFGGRFGGRP